MGRVSVLVGLSLALGCASSPVVPEAALEFKATGSVQRGSRGASFDAAHVVNPSISLTRHRDGSWSGTFARSGSGNTIPIDVSVTKDAIRGIGFVLVATQPEPGKTVYDGAFDGRRFRFELTASGLTAKTPVYDGTFSGSLVPGDTLRFEGGGLILTGEATALGAPPWPHLALALVAAFI
jgi:hypothetical protein